MFHGKAKLIEYFDCFLLNRFTINRREKLLNWHYYKFNVESFRRKQFDPPIKQIFEST